MLTTRARAPAAVRSRGLLFVLSGNMLIDALEVSLVAVAMPAIGRDLGVGPGSVQWVMSGFAIGFGGLLVPGARLVERVGRRRVYLGALAAFAAVSIVGGVAGSLPLLVATRVIKGACVALTAPTGLAIIGGTYPEGPTRNRAVSTYSLFGASGFAVGLVLSGVLTEISWRWTFVSPAPAALVLLVLGARLIPRDDDRHPGGRPRLGSRLLTHPSLVRSALGAGALNGSHWGLLFVATFDLQTRIGWAPLAAALILLPASAMLAVATPWSPRLVRRLGPARLIAVGSAGPPLGVVAYLLSGRSPGGLLVAIVLVGLGFVCAFAAFHVQAVSGAPPERVGVVGSVYQTSVQLGGALVLVATATLYTGLGAAAALGIVLAVGVLGFGVGVIGYRKGVEA